MIRGLFVVALVGSLLGLASSFKSPLVNRSARAEMLPPVAPVMGLSAPRARRDSLEPSCPAQLRREVLKSIAHCPGRPSVVISAPAYGWRLSYRDTVAQNAASLIKLPIMIIAFAMRERGELDFKEELALLGEDITGGSGRLQHAAPGARYSIGELIERMITESDNTATNALIRRLGREKLAAEFAALGLKETRLDHAVLKSARDNPTNAAEIATLLARLSAREPATAAAKREGITPFSLIPPAAREEMRRILGRCRNRRRLGRYLPESMELAHKTGTLAQSVHDAGIVRFANQDLVVTVLVEEAADREATEKWLGDLARQVVRAMTDTAARGHGEG